MLPRGCVPIAGIVLGMLLVRPSAHAQVAPKLDSVSVQWFQRGTTNEVTLAGDALAGVNALGVTGSGIQGSVVVPVRTNLALEASGGGLSAAAPVSAKSANASLVIAADAALGARELRVLGPNGVSNPLTIQISDLPEVREPKPNNRSTEAPLVTLPVAVSGVIEQAAESDWYRFAARAGQHLLFDVQANRTGSPLDSTLTIHDSAGKELARSEDANGLDSFIEFTPPADGTYLVQLHDLRFQGAGDYKYRLVAGEIPYLDELFPCGGRRGSSVELSLRGRNLDGADRMTLRIAPDAPLGRQDVRAHTPRGLSNPLPFEASDLPDFNEAEPNNDKEKANAVGGAVALNGRIGPKDGVDVYRVRPAADQKLVLETRARSFGSPLDVLLILSDAAGNILQQNDYASGPDARIEFDAKKDTDYLVTVKDLTDRGGDRFGYRLTIQPPNTTPDYVVRANVGRVRVSRGGHTAVRCEVERRNGFNGVVRIHGRDLPAGVSTSTLVIPPEGPQFGWVEVAATPAAPAGNHSPLQFAADAELSGSLTTRAVQFSEGSYLTVLNSAPFVLDATTPALQIEQNAGGQLDVSVLRSAGFSGEVKILAEELPGVSFGGLTIPAGQSRGKLPVNAAFNCEVSTRWIQLRGEATVDGQPVVIAASAPVPLTVTGVPFYITAMLPGSPFFRTDPVKLSAVALPTNTLSAANSSEFVVKVERRNFPADILLSLEGVPAGVIATTTNLTGNAKEAAIRLLVTEQTATGTNFTLNVVGSAVSGDRTFRQRTVPITLSVAAPEKPAAAPATASASPAPTAANTPSTSAAK